VSVQVNRAKHTSTRNALLKMIEAKMLASYGMFSGALAISHNLALREAVCWPRSI
jgi:hypothetical protein